MNDCVLAGLRFLKSESLEELADAMLEVSQMASRAGRDQVFDRVRHRSRGFSPVRNDRDAVDVRNFIIACGEDDTSFDELLDAIATWTGGDDPGLIALLGLVPMLLPRAPLTKTELRDLLALHPDRALTGDELARGLRCAWPDWDGSDDYPLPGDVREAVLLLLNVSSADEGMRRVLRFVNWIADLAALKLIDPQGLDRDLRGWVTRVAGAHGLDLASCQTPAASAEDRGPALLIELASAKPGSFSVLLSLWIPGSGFRTLDWDAELCTLEGLRDRVDELIELASGEAIGVEGDLGIESLLGADAIHHDVDWWTCDNDDEFGMPQPLGSKYTVVVRSRSRTAKNWRDWAARWKVIKGATRSAAALAVWVENGAVTMKSFGPQLQGQDRILIGPFGSTTEFNGTTRLLFNLALGQGLPVALCLRGEVSNAIAQIGPLRDTLGGASVADLPGLVRDWRYAAYLAYLEGGDHFGRNLVLLWDDYERRPPGAEDKLRLPALKGTP
jgi:hypothetical protein